MDSTDLGFAELETYRNQGRGVSAGKYLRYYCPLHGSDKQRSLSVNPDNGRFQCFSCGAWGYLREHRKDEKPYLRSKGSGGYTKGASIQARYLTSKDIDYKPVVIDEIVRQPLCEALNGSLGQKYLEYRGISLSVAETYSLGFAEQGKWPHFKDDKPVRQWKWGRVVFPHTDLSGSVVNLYGRAVGADDKVPKEVRHDHLPGKKGVFNAQALSSETVFICEGPFDALSLIAAGHSNSCAIFGVHGLSWDMVGAANVVLCLDQDAAGEQWREIAWDGVLRGKNVFWLPPEVYRGCKDLGECWMKYRVLDITLPK